MTVPNLQEIMDDLQITYFDTLLDVDIAWFPWNRIKGLATAEPILGLYSPKKALIEIHPVLARAWVPRYVLEDTIWHEVCHVAQYIHDDAPIVYTFEDAWHGRDFDLLARLYHKHDDAIVWIAANRAKLHRSAAREAAKRAKTP